MGKLLSHPDLPPPPTLVPTPPLGIRIPCGEWELEWAGIPPAPAGSHDKTPAPIYASTTEDAMTDADEIARLQAQIAAANAETARLNAITAARPPRRDRDKPAATQTGPLYVGQVRPIVAKVGEKRGISFTGLTAQFPHTFYVQQLEPLLHFLLDGQAAEFIRQNAHLLEVKVPDGPDTWAKVAGTPESAAECERIAALLDTYGPRMVESAEVVEVAEVGDGA